MVEGLRVKDIIIFARQHFNVDEYLSEYKKNKLPDRRFL